MRQKYWYLGSICSVAMTVASILACGDTALQEDCTFDEDCSAGYICDGAEGFCVQTCASDTECSSGEICAPRASAPNGDKTCQADPNVNNGDCQDNEDCNSNEICINNACVVPNQPTDIYRYIQILNTSSGSDSCDSKTSNGLFDAGSDIFMVTLLDSSGTAIGYAEAIDYEQGSGRVDTTDFGILDGNPPNVDNRDCPAAEGGTSFRTDSVVSLGCGGYLLLGFKGTNGLVNIENGMQIFVGEYAPICNQNGTNPTGSDTYVVSICTDTDAASNQNVSSCTKQVGGRSGGNSVVTVSGL
jgi:hypothetical protein